MQQQNQRPRSGIRFELVGVDALSALITQLGAEAAQRVWKTHSGQSARVPRYPALPAWMALTDALKRRGGANLGRETHRAFLAAYQAELDALDAAR